MFYILRPLSLVLASALTSLAWAQAVPVKLPSNIAEFTELRASYGARADFEAVCGTQTPALKNLNEQRKTNNFALILPAAQVRIAECPVDILARIAKITAERETGVATSAEDKAFAKGLVDSILASGDGKTPQTAYKVISLDEEHAILRIRGLNFQKQKLIDLPPPAGNPVDEITSINSKGETIVLYFNPQAHFVRLARELAVVSQNAALHTASAVPATVTPAPALASSAAANAAPAVSSLPAENALGSGVPSAKTIATPAPVAKPVQAATAHAVTTPVVTTPTPVAPTPVPAQVTIPTAVTKPASAPISKASTQPQIGAVVISAPAQATAQGIEGETLTAAEAAAFAQRVVNARREAASAPAVAPSIASDNAAPMLRWNTGGRNSLYEAISGARLAHILCKPWRQSNNNNWLAMQDAYSSALQRQNPQWSPPRIEQQLRTEEEEAQASVQSLYNRLGCTGDLLAIAQRYEDFSNWPTMQVLSMLP